MAETGSVDNNSSNDFDFDAVLERILDRFDEAWRCGDVPSIERYLTAILKTRGAQPSESRRLALIDLIAIDLEYRWKLAGDERLAVRNDSGDRASLPDRPVLEDYVNCFPELGSAVDLPSELIVEEYRARHQWGDHPGHDEYQKRFEPNHRHIADSLIRADRDFVIEGVPQTGDSALLPQTGPVGVTLTMEGVDPEAWSYEIRADVQRLGRAEDAEIRLAHPSVSRYHCRFWQADGTCYVEDMGSTNGTFVNQNKTEKHKLEPGDHILLGTFELIAVTTASLQHSPQQKNDPPAVPIERPTAAIDAPDEQQDEERRLAAEVHHRLTPSRRLALPNLLIEVANRPSGQLGGDFFECIDRGDYSVLAMFDPMIHGTRAALAITLLRAELNRWVALTDSPAACMKWVNAELHALAINDIYICGCLAFWYPRRHAMVLTTAGHHPPIIIRDGVSLDIRLEPNGMPLGALASEAYSEDLIELQPMDRVFLFTDGTIELLRDGRISASSADFLESELLKHRHRDLVEQVNLTMDIGRPLTDDALLVGCYVLDDA